MVAFFAGKNRVPSRRAQGSGELEEGPRAEDQDVGARFETGAGQVRKAQVWR